MKKTLTLIPMVAAALTLWASPAAAHTPTVSSKCDTLTVALKWYEDGSTVTVTVDGDTTEATFGGDYHNTFHGTESWSVVVDNNGEGYDSKHAGEFADCTPTTTVPTTTRVIGFPTPVTTPMTTGTFGNDCDTRTAWVQFDNKGDAADRISVAGRIVDVPANGFARVNLDAYTPTQFFYGPISSLVTNRPAVIVNGPEVDATGNVTVGCVYLDTAVESRIVEQPTQLAFTGASDTLFKVLAAAGLMAVGAGLVKAAEKRKLA